MNRGTCVTSDGYHESAAEKLRRVRDEIAAAAKAAGRAPGSVELIAVSKTFDAGGRSPRDRRRPSRLWRKPRAGGQGANGRRCAREFPALELHLIGPLQSNKAKEAVALFDAIHTHRPRRRSPRRVAEEMAKQGRRLQLFVQVNTGEEPQKAGVMPSEADGFVDFCRDELKLDIAGLMCIPPLDEEPAVHFAFLAKLARELGSTVSAWA